MRLDGKRFEASSTTTIAAAIGAIAAAAKAVPDFGIATECGWGRTSGPASGRFRTSCVNRLCIAWSATLSSGSAKAHASETWTAQELREAFERQAEARGRAPGDELSSLLQSGGVPDVDGFWEDVSTNLAAKRLRLLFVADRIPDPLAQVVSFLNAQMPGIEVLAVEIKRFHGKSAQTLVPRVIGRTSASSARTPGNRLTRESFLGGFANEDVRAVAERLLDAAADSGGTIDYGASYGLSIRAKCRAWERPISVAWLYSREGTGWMRTRDFSFGAALFDAELPVEMRSILKRWADEFSGDGFAEDVSSKGVEAWAARHDTGVQHQDVLVDRLHRVVSELAAL